MPAKGGLEDPMSRAKRRMYRAQGRLADEQAQRLEDERRQRERDLGTERPWWRQPTVGEAIAKIRRDRER
jgi:hypothetical protein